MAKPLAAEVELIGSIANEPLGPLTPMTQLSVPTEADRVQFAGTLKSSDHKVVAVRWMEAECFFSGLA